MFVAFRLAIPAAALVQAAGAPPVKANVKPLSGQTDNQTSFYGPRSCRIFDVECCQRR